jgi:hypothetical protein
MKNASSLGQRTRVILHLGVLATEIFSIAGVTEENYRRRRSGQNLVLWSMSITVLIQMSVEP